MRGGLLLLVVWTVLTCIQAGRLDYWGDEIGSLEGASESTGDILRGKGADFHPPLYFLILHGWIRLFGYGEYAVRSLSVLAAAATILLTVSLARVVGVTRPGTAAVFLGLSPFWLLFCGMARYYGLSALVFVATLLTFVFALRRDSATRWVLNGFMLALAGYTNYLTLAAAFVTQMVWVVAYHRRCVLRWAAATMLAAVFLAPLAALVLHQTRGMILWGERASFFGDWRTAVWGACYPLYVLAASETILPWHWWFSVPLLASSWFLVLRARRPPLLQVTLASGVVVSLLVVSLVARSLPLAYLPSRLLFLAPVWAVLLAAGAQRVGKWGVVALAGVALGYAGGIVNLVRGVDFHNPAYVVPWRQVVQLIRDDTEPDKLVVTTEEYPLLHYGQGLRFQLVRPGERTTEELAGKAAAVVWLVQRDRADQQRHDITFDAEAWLREHYDTGPEHEFVRLASLERQVRRLVLRREPSEAALTVTRFTRPW
ncbi:glycosyltransferase family 39 protein [Candidatus Fermentibacteria bacterium]|nr:glycosyltransferase family 39 protein [Candidatus Fermentibacteria bacterium]